MSGRELALSIVSGEPAANDLFFRRYGRLLEKAVTGLQYGDAGNVLPLPLFARRVASIAAPLVLFRGESVGDPFPETIASLRLRDLFLASAAAFGDESAAALVAARLRPLASEPGSRPIDFAAFDGRSPLLVYAAIAASPSAAPGGGCPSAAALAAHAAAGPRDEASDAAAAHAPGCARCRSLVERALAAASRGGAPRPVTLPPPGAISRTRLGLALLAATALAAAAALALFRAFRG